MGIYPNDESLPYRLSGAPLLEQTDEGRVSRRYLWAESLAGLYPEETATPVTIHTERREALLVTT